MRATRDRRRRRRHLTRKRAELLAHIQNTNSQYDLPEIGPKLADKANREGVAERFPELAVQKSMEVGLALIGYSDPLRSDMELPNVKAAKQHDAPPLYRLQPVPGIGKILSLGLWYELHDIQRVPRGQDVVAYGRLGTCRQESAGQRDGTAGTKIGQASLQGPFLKPRYGFCGTTQRAQNLSPASRKHLGRAKR